MLLESLAPGPQQWGVDRCLALVNTRVRGILARTGGLTIVCE